MTTTTRVAPVSKGVVDRGTPGVLPNGYASPEDFQPLALDAYAAANSRPPSLAEVQQLAALAAQYQSAAYHQGATGWEWVHDAIADAVAAGSAFVAPRRIERILRRWATQGRQLSGAKPETMPTAATRNRMDGRPSAQRGSSRAPIPSVGSEGDVADAEPPPGPPVAAGEVAAVPSAMSQPTDDAANLRGRSPRSQRPKARRPQFVVDPATGLTNGQCWALVLDELRQRVSPAAFQAWLKPTALLACEANGALVVGAPSSTHAAWLEDRLRADIELAVRRVLGRSARLEFVAEPSWRAARDEGNL